MFNLCHFLNVTFMRVEDAGLTALEIGTSIYSQGAGKTKAGGGQARAQMSSGFFPFLPGLCLAWGAADFGCPALPPCRDAHRGGDEQALVTLGQTLSLRVFGCPQPKGDHEAPLL